MAEKQGAVLDCRDQIFSFHFQYGWWQFNVRIPVFGDQD